MTIKTFREKDIRNTILSKVKPEIRRKRSKHTKGYIYLDGKMVAKVKLPNGHNQEMKESKSKYIANDLKLEHDDFNNLIECPLRGPAYYRKLRKYLST